MKKTKKISLFVCVLLAFSSLLFASCDFSFNTGGSIFNYHTIETPEYLKVITTDDSKLVYYTDYNNLALIVNENPNAQGYAFYVYGGNGDNSNLSLYTRFKTEKNFIELKDVFGEEENKILFEKKRYYFYAVALGGKINDTIYKDSSNSPILFIDFKTQLETPILTLNKKTKTIGWQNIENAVSYEIWESATTEPLSFEKVTQVESGITSFNFSDYFNEKKRDLLFMVRAISDKNSYSLNSQFSNTVLFSSELTLFNPSDLQINDYTLTWEIMEYADSYKIIIDDTQEFVSDTNVFDLSYLKDSAGSHSITVISQSEIENIVVDTETTKIYKDVYVNLPSPTNIVVSQSGKKINVVFSSSPLAKSFLVKVGNEILFNALTENNFTYDISNRYTENNQIKFSISANGYGFYLNSIFAISDNFTYTQQLKTPEILDIVQIGRNKNLKVGLTPLDKKITVYIICDGYNEVFDYILNGGVNYVYIDISEYLLDDFVYKISVSSQSYNSYTISSEKSAEFSYTNNLPFATPKFTSIKLSSNKANIILTWEKITDATKYKLYVNDNEFAVVEDTTYTISKSEITELEGGGYNFNIQALATKGYLDSILDENTYYAGIDSIDKPSGIRVTKATNGYTIIWDTIKNAVSYNIYINNDNFSTNNTTYVYETMSTAPFQIILKANAYSEEYSSYSDKIMYNPNEKTFAGYTDKYVYFNGWQDFYVTDENEFFTLCKYAFYSYTSLNIFIDSCSNINDTNFIEKYKEGARDFGTNNINISYNLNSVTTSDLSGMIAQISLEYKDGTQTPAVTSTNSNYNTYAEQKYFTPSQKTRSDDYNDFVTEKSLIEVEVSNTNELYICAEGGAKPIFTKNNYQAEESYEKAKEILRNIITDDMTDFEKALSIYDYINYISVYDSFYATGTYADRRYWLNGPLLGGVGVCDGFAKLYSLLCNMEGLKTIKITGYTIDEYGNSSGHAWNKIYIDADGNGEKEWYNVDLTWDGGVLIQGSDSKIYELSTHLYFLLSDRQFENHFGYFYNDIKAGNDFNCYDYMTFGTNKKSFHITTIEQLTNYIIALKNNYETYNGRDIYIDIKNMTPDNALTLANSNILASVSFVHITVAEKYTMIFLGTF